MTRTHSQHVAFVAHELRGPLMTALNAVSLAPSGPLPDAIGRRRKRVWRKAAGVEPTRERLAPPPGFEAQSHRRVRVPSDGIAHHGTRLPEAGPDAVMLPAERSGVRQGLSARSTWASRTRRV